MAALFTVAGLELEMVSLIIGVAVGYIVGSLIAKVRYSMMGGMMT